MLSKSTKVLLFDLGNVLLPIAPEKSIAAFSKLKGSPIPPESIHSDLFQSYEKGLISSDAFLQGLRDMLQTSQVTDEELKQAWNALLLDFLPESLSLLTKLSQQFPVFLLSNTNQIHVEFINLQFLLGKGHPALHHFFRKAYYSYEIGMRKPDSEIYEFVLKDMGFDAEEVFFIDDHPENIKTAEKLGIQVFHNTFPERHLEIWKHVGG